MRKVSGVDARDDNAARAGELERAGEFGGGGFAGSGASDQRGDVTEGNLGGKVADGEGLRRQRLGAVARLPQGKIRLRAVAASP